jgi:ZIP family zinc transporter
LEAKSSRETPPVVAKANTSSYREQADSGVYRAWAIKFEEAWPGLLMAAIAGASTTLGGLCILFLPPEGPPPEAMGFSLSLAAGVMMAIAFEMLVPHHPGEHDYSHSSWEYRSLKIFAISALCCLLFLRAGRALEFLGLIQSEVERQDGETTRDYQSRRLSILLFISLTAHNLPEGFAVAVSAISNSWLGIMVCIAIALHNIPEGVALAITTYDATGKKKQAILMSFYSGLAEPLGAIIAIFVLKSYITPGLIDDLLTGVAGVMFCIAISELIPEACKTRAWCWIISGFIMGVALMVVTHEIIEHHASE